MYGRISNVRCKAEIFTVYVFFYCASEKNYFTVFTRVEGGHFGDFPENCTKPAAFH